MSMEVTNATTYTTRWTVNSLAAQLVAEMCSDANAADAPVPAKKLAVVRRCGARLWDGHDWRFRRRQFTLDVWPDQSGTCTGVYDGTNTTITAATGTFYESMVNHSLVVTGTGAGTFEIVAWTSATVITVSGNCAASASAWSVTANGTYQLPSWVAKIDQRSLVERTHEGDQGIRITEDVQQYQRVANQVDQDDTGESREPEILCIVRNTSATTFQWCAKVQPETDDVYRYDIWAIVRNPFETDSLADATAIPWPESLDTVWEHFSRWMMNLSFGTREDAPALKKVYDSELQKQKDENDETLTTPNELLDTDPYGDFAALRSQSWPL